MINMHLPALSSIENTFSRPTIGLVSAFLAYNFLSRDTKSFIRNSTKSLTTQ